MEEKIHQDKWNSVTEKVIFREAFLEFQTTKNVKGLGFRLPSTGRTPRLETLGRRPTTIHLHILHFTYEP